MFKQKRKRGATQRAQEEQAPAAKSSPSSHQAKGPGHSDQRNGAARQDGVRREQSAALQRQSHSGQASKTKRPVP